MKKDETIILHNRQKATIITGDESRIFNNIYIVELEDGQRRVIDRKTLSLVPRRK